MNRLTQKKNVSGAIEFSLVFIFIGGIFLLVIGIMFYNQYRFMQTAKATTAVVVDYVVPKGRRLPQPIFEFVSEDKKTRVYHHPEGTDPPSYRMGQEVVLYYNPADPNDVSVGYRTIPMVILGFVGGVLLVIGIVLRNNDK